MNSSRRRSRIRPTSVAFACPACQTIIGTVDRCPNCHFTGGDTMTLFQGSPPLVDAINDAASIWDGNDLKIIAKARQRASRRFPQFRWSICTVELPEKTNLRLYGFWMLNVCPLRANEAETDRLWTVLLLINVTTLKAAAIPAYAAEPWLGNDQWDKALASMAASWKAGSRGQAVADFLASATTQFESSWRQVSAALTDPSAP